MKRGDRSARDRWSEDLSIEGLEQPPEDIEV